MNTRVSRLLAPLVASALGCLIAAEASAATFCVNPGGTGGCLPTITAAIAAAALNATTDVINVQPGTYNENVVIAEAGLTLQGAGAATTTINGTNAGLGVVTIQAANVELDGFTITAAGSGVGTAIGVYVKTAGTGATISNNVVRDIDAVGAGLPAAQGIYLENGPDDVSILDNEIRGISGIGSTKGIFIGDSSAADPSIDVLIEGNTIEDISSSMRGAYGVLANNGVSTSVTATGFTQDLGIFDNDIDLLQGQWAHGVGLEGDTPDAIVEGNTFGTLTDMAPTSTPPDAVAVFFEANPSFADAEVHLNGFKVGTVGIALHPSTPPGPTVVDGTCNWWGSASGPGPVGPGTGALVGPRVVFQPWLISPTGQCIGDPATEPADCQKNAWKNHIRADGTTFKNQGACLSYVKSLT